MWNDIYNPAKCEIRNLLLFLNVEIVLWNPSLTASVAYNECQSITFCLSKTLRLTNIYYHIEESEGCPQFWREPKINKQRLKWKCKKLQPWMHQFLFSFVNENSLYKSIFTLKTALSLSVTKLRAEPRILCCESLPASIMVHYFLTDSSFVHHIILDLRISACKWGWFGIFLHSKRRYESAPVIYLTLGEIVKYKI